MPELNGFEVLQALPASNPLPLVIFATAFDEHALAAFEANALAYLLKPIHRDRLRQAVERAQLLAANQSQAESEQRLLRAMPSIAPLAQLVARKRDRYLLIRPEQVIFLRIEDGLLHIHTENGNFWTDYQINDLEARLTTPPFFRAHRSVIVNLRKVREIAPMGKGSFLLMMNDQAATEIQVSERQSRKLRELLGL